MRKTALALGVLGVALLALTKSASGSSLAGDGLMIVWLLTFAIYASLLRYVSTRYGIVFITALVGVLGTLMLIVGGLAIGAGGAIAHTTDTLAIGGMFFGEIVLLSALVAPLAFARAVRNSGVAVATSAVEYISIGVGVVFSVAVIHEHWQPLLGVAGAIMVASLALTFAPADLFSRAGRARPIA